MTYRAAAAFALIAILAAAAPALADSRKPCKNCQLRKHYDSREVVRTTRDIDRSRVINTQTVVPVPRKVRETNHLVVRENQIRNVGVIRHNHTIIEKETRYRRARPLPPATVINYVVHNYKVIRRAENARAQACTRCLVRTKKRRATVLDVRG